MQKQTVSEVRHNAAERRFELDVDGQIVFTEYRLAAGTIIFHHTLTPRALRGQGLAARVVEAALTYARAENLKVMPLCWYVGEYIRSHPEYQDLLEPRS